MTIETEVPMSADYFILCLMRLDREHYQRIEAVRSAMGDDMEYLLFAPNDELEDLIPEYLSFPEEGLPVKGGWMISRNTWVFAQLYILWSRYWNNFSRQVANHIHQITVGGNNDLGVISQCFTYGLKLLK